MEYAAILIITLLISPAILRLASDQKKKTKQNLRIVYLCLLAAAGLASYFAQVTYPLAILVTQIILLLPKKSLLDSLTVLLNLVNTIVFFAAMILTRPQEFNLWAVIAIFLILIGNIVGLTLINRDRWLK